MAVLFCVSLFCVQNLSVAQPVPGPAPTPGFRSSTIKSGDPINLDELLGPGSSAFLTIRGSDTSGVRVVLKSKFTNVVPKIAAFPAAADGGLYLPPGSSGSMNGAMFTGKVPRQSTKNTPDGKRLIEIVQSSNGNRLYLVDKLALPSDPLEVVVEIRP